MPGRKLFKLSFKCEVANLLLKPIGENMPHATFSCEMT